MGSIHSMAMRKTAAPSGFSGNVIMLSMAGSTTASIANNWMSINGTGNYLIATSYGNNPLGRNYLSTDAGVTWTKMSTPVGDGNNFRQAWVSRDGVYRVYAINQQTGFTAAAYSSNNSGTNYTTTNLTNLQGAFVSDDGNVKLVAVDTGLIYRIYNSPTTNTFSTTVGGSSMNRGAIKGSSNGQYILSSSNAAGMQFSSDYGATFASLAGAAGLTGSTTTNMNDMAVSGNGQYMIITGAGYKLWRTANYGATWTTLTGTGGLPNTSIYTSTANSWSACTASKTGQYMSVAGYFNQGSTFGTNGYVFISSDYGVTWTSKLVPLPTTAADPAFLTSTMSYTDAGVPNRIFMATYGQGIYYINF